jgi:hypothetical protein
MNVKDVLNHINFHKMFVKTYLIIKINTRNNQKLKNHVTKETKT